MKINRYLIIAGCILLTGCGAQNDTISSDGLIATSTPTVVAVNTTAPTDEPTPVATSTPDSEPTATETIAPTATPVPTATPEAVKPGSSESYSIKSDWEFSSFAKISSGSATLYKTSSSNPKNKTICVNAGHGTKGGSNYSVQCHPDGSAKIVSGSTAAGKTTATAIAYGTEMKDGTSEATVTKKLALALKDVLLAYGYNVLMIRESDDVALDNIARTVMANNLADCHIALHYDSTSSDKGAFYMSVPNVASYKEMYPVSKTWKESNRLGDSIMAGFKANNIKIFSSGSMEMDLVQMSYSTIPNIDLEVGDTASDYSAETLNKLSQGILSGLDIFYK